MIPFTQKNQEDIKEAITDEVKKKLKEKGKGYISFPLTKKDGSQRWIHAPHFLVKNAQKVVLSNIPTPSVTLFDYEVINGFIPGRSILDNARPHIGKRVVLSIDLKNFFPSFTRDEIKRQFNQTKISIADHVIDLCTTVKGRLPQGAPTSPMIANWCSIDGDRALVEFCEKHRLDYTRYADDLTFSTHREGINNEELEELLQIINTSFGRQVKVAPKKIKFMRSHKQQRVTGIVVNEKLSIPRARRRKLRAFMHDAEVNGIEAALSREGRSVHEIFGEMSFLHLAHKEQAIKYIETFKELL